MFRWEDSTMNSKKSNRRGFLKGSAALAGLAVGAMPFTSAQTLSTDTPDARPLTHANFAIVQVRVSRSLEGMPESIQRRLQAVMRRERRRIASPNRRRCRLLRGKHSRGV